MRNTNEIIADLKHNIEWSQPNVRYNNLMELVKELEQTLNPVKAEPVVITAPTSSVTIEVAPVVEETETPIIEETTSVEDAVEETSTTEETVTPKKGRKPSAA